MSVVTYKIQRWDAVIPPGKSIPAPLVYIYPDTQLKNQEGKVIAVRFRDTGSPYDTLMTTARVYNSGEFPNLRPNFFEQTGYYVLHIDMPWLKYPPANGVVDTVVAMPQDIPVTEEYFPFKKRPKTSCLMDDEERSMDSNQIGFILVALVVIFGTLFWISLDKKVTGA